MKTSKKVIGFVLASITMIALFVMFTILTMAEQTGTRKVWIDAGQCGDNVFYEYYDPTSGDNDPSGVLTIKGIGPMWDYEKNPSSTMANTPWANNGYRFDIQKVVIEEGVTTVGSFAFFNLSQCTEVSIPLGITSIGEWSFAYTDITSVNIPMSVKSIRHFAFEQTSLLKDGEKNSVCMGFPAIDDIKYTSTSTNHYLINDLVLPVVENAEEHGQLCTGIDWTYSVITKTLTLSSHYDGLMNTAVYEMIRLLPTHENLNPCPWSKYRSDIQHVYVTPGISNISQYAFADLPALKSVIIGKHVETIETRAFKGATSLKSKIVLPAATTCIEDNAFQLCEGLTVTTPHTRDEIGSAFSNTGNTGVTFRYAEDIDQENQPIVGTLPGCAITWTFLPKAGILTLEPMPGGGTTAIPNFVNSNQTPWAAWANEIYAVVVDAGIYEIGKYAFANFPNLVTVDLRNSTVLRIREFAFANASSLLDIFIPPTMVSIASYAFENCNDISFIHADGFSFTVSPMGNSRFCEVMNHNSVTPPPVLPDEPEDIDPSGACGVEATWVYDSTTKTLTISGTGATVNYSVAGSAPWSPYIMLIENLIVGEGITVIGPGLMSGATSLKDVKLPSTIKGIEANAFAGCLAIKTAYADCNEGDIVALIPDGNQTLIAKLTYKNGGSVTPPPAGPDCDGNHTDANGDGKCDDCGADVEIDVPGDGSLSGECGVSATWTYDPTTKTLVISGTGATNSYNSTNPAPWNAYIGQIEKLIVKNGIILLSSGLMSGATSLKDVTLPSTILAVGPNTFNGCDAIETAYADCSESQWVISPTGNETLIATIKFKDSPVPDVNPGGAIPGTSVEWAYDIKTQSLTIKGTEMIPNYTTTNPAPWTPYAANIKSVMLNEGITAIGDYAFANMTSVIDVHLPKTLTTIGKNSFAGCTALEVVKLPRTLTGIGEAAFRGCSSLEEIEIPSGIKTIAPDTFSDCTSLESVVLNKGLETIDKRAFHNCSALKTIELPATLREIGEQAFYNCTALKGVTIKASPLAIRKDAFAGCSAINKVILDGVGEPDPIEEGNEYLTDHFVSATAQGTLPNGVMWEVDRINGTLRFFGEGEVVLDDAWKNELQYIDTVIFENGITGLADNLFKNDANVEYVIIADSVTSIGNSAFELCQNLKSVSMSQKLEKLGTKAFAGCRSLLSIALPDTLTVIPDSAFESCGALKGATLGKYVTSIGPKAFKNCTSLEEIVIPATVSTLSQGAFSGCTALTKVTLSDGKLAPLSTGIFDGCLNIQTVIFDGTKTQWNVLTANADEELKNATVDCYITWTVNFVYEGGDKNGQVVCPPNRYSGKTGENFTIVVPSLEHYTPTSTKLDYTFGTENQEFTIYYKPNIYTVVVGYADAKTGDKLAASTSVVLTYGESCTIYSHNIPGYTARTSSMVVDVATGNKTVKFEYDINQYTYRIEYRNQETGALLDTKEFLVDYKTKVMLSSADMPAFKGYSLADYDKTYTIESVENNEQVIAVYYTPNTEKITIHYVDEAGNKVAPDKIIDIKFGQTITVDSPVVESKKPAAPVLIENYNGDVVEFTVTYQRKEYTVTVNFVRDSVDGEIAYAPMIFTVKHGDNFAFDLADYADLAPMVGYKVENGKLALTNVTADASLTIIYDRISVTLTIHYVDEFGNTVADDEVITVLYGDAINVASPEIEGMKPAAAVVFGAYTGDPAEVTVTYDRKEYTVTVNFVKEKADGAIAYAPMTFTVKHGDNFAFDLADYADLAPMVGYKVENGKLALTNVTADASLTIIYDRISVTLTIHYVDEFGNTVADDEVITVLYGDAINVASPEIEGMKPAAAVVFGAYTGDPAEMTVKYERKDYKVTVNFVKDEVGGVMLYDSLTVTVKHGDDYTFDLSAQGGNYAPIEGYEVKDSVLSLTDIKSDSVLNVVYTRRQVTLTIHYVDEFGNKIAEDYVITVLYGEMIYVASPKIEGMNNVEPIMIPTFKGEESEITVHYERKEYKVTVNFVKDQIGGTVAYPPLIVPVKHGDSYTFDLSAQGGNYAPMEGYEVKSPVLSLENITDNAALTLVYTRISYDVTIEYVGEDGNKIAEDKIITVLYGDAIDEVSPDVEGMKPAAPVQVESFKGEQLTYTVKYERKEYKVTVNFVKDKVGGDVLYKTLTLTVKHGDSYTFDLNAQNGDYAPMEGYEVKAPVLSLENIEADSELNVVYTRIAYSVTIQYVDEHGQKVAEDKTITVLHGDSVDVKSPAVEGMKPAANFTLDAYKGDQSDYSVVYERKEYKIVIHFVEKDTDTWPLFDDLEILVKHGDSYTFSLADHPEYISPAYETDCSSISFEAVTEDVEAVICYTPKVVYLTVEYRNEDGEIIATEIYSVKAGTVYTIPSKIIEGYLVVEKQEGVMGTEDKTITITLMTADVPACDGDHIDTNKDGKCDECGAEVEGDKPGKPNKPDDDEDDKSDTEKLPSQDDEGPENFDVPTVIIIGAVAIGCVELVFIVRYVIKTFSNRSKKKKE